jgi:hypothetical protein
VACVIALAGCGSDGDSPQVTATPTAGQLEIGNTINYGSFGTTAGIDCADGKSVNVGGSNNTLNVRGTCSIVLVSGADNRITFEKIDKELSVIGLNNTVIYGAGQPKVNNLGTGNDIRKG